MKIFFFILLAYRVQDIRNGAWLNDLRTRLTLQDCKQSQIGIPDRWRWKELSPISLEIEWHRKLNDLQYPVLAVFVF